MQERSKRIKLRDEAKLDSINDETKQLFKKYVKRISSLKDQFII